MSQLRVVIANIRSDDLRRLAAAFGQTSYLFGEVLPGEHGRDRLRFEHWESTDCEDPQTLADGRSRGPSREQEWGFDVEAFLAAVERDYGEGAGQENWVITEDVLIDLLKQFEEEDGTDGE